MWIYPQRSFYGSNNCFTRCNRAGYDQIKLYNCRLRIHRSQANLYWRYETVVSPAALLSSLEGAAISSIKIENVQHEFSTIEAVKSLKAPITFIHGEADDFVLPQNSIDNYEACTSKKELILVPDAEHGVSYIKDTQKVAQALESIFENYFS